MILKSQSKTWKQITDNYKLYDDKLQLIIERTRNTIEKESKIKAKIYFEKIFIKG